MFYEHWIRPFLFRLDPETAHELVSKAAKAAQAVPGALALIRLVTTAKAHEPRTLFGRTFAHPIGLAAGFDKNAELVPFLHALGFSFVEVGSITHQASAGNPRPRIFRLPEDKALINRMGLNNKGAEAAALALENRVWPCPVGINLAKTHSPAIVEEAGIRDLCKSFSLLQDKGDYVCLNISCPNTSEGKTFEDLPLLRLLLQELKKLRTGKPLLLKVSPDISLADLEKIITLALDFGLSGLVLGNTSHARAELRSANFTEKGGLSGHPLFGATYDRLVFAREKVPSSFVLIACGGIDSGERARRCLDAGADLLQIYTGLIYKGPALLRECIAHSAFRFAHFRPSSKTHSPIAKSTE
ncbi:MAG: quinone-dependent dihydroorotate dehydrogenase [Oligoflexia bacterium]|nr:quinone-dependent dihydroorotate dehydrogenase [Oligoflexia bacterium]